LEDGPVTAPRPGGPAGAAVASRRRRELLEESAKGRAGAKAYGARPKGGNGGKARKAKTAAGLTPPRGGLFRRFLVWAFWTFLGISVFCLAAAVGVYAYFSQDLPGVESLGVYRPPAASILYSRDGRVIGEL
jgi:hypothetical protein